MAKSVRDGLFLSQNTPLNLPYLYVSIAVLMTVTAPLYSRLSKPFPIRNVIAGSQIVVSLSMLLFWRLLSSRPGIFALASFYIWVSIYGAICVSQFWLISAQLHDARAAKRLFGFIGSGGILGGILGGFGARWIAASRGAEQLLPVIALFALFCAAIVKLTSLNEKTPAEGSTAHCGSADENIRRLQRCEGITLSSVDFCCAIYHRTHQHLRGLSVQTDFPECIS